MSGTDQIVLNGLFFFGPVTVIPVVAAHKGGPMARWACGSASCLLLWLLFLFTLGDEAFSSVDAFGFRHPSHFSSLLVGLLSGAAGCMLAAAISPAANPPKAVPVGRKPAPTPAPTPAVPAPAPSPAVHGTPVRPPSATSPAPTPRPVRPRPK